jgi:formiminotetrahydrofolate cyclodeaminase
MGLAAVEGAGYNVRINLTSLKDAGTVNRLKKEAQSLANEAREVADEIKQLVESKL